MSCLAFLTTMNTITTLSSDPCGRQEASTPGTLYVLGSLTKLSRPSTSQLVLVELVFKLKASVPVPDDERDPTQLPRKPRPGDLKPLSLSSQSGHLPLAYTYRPPESGAQWPTIEKPTSTLQ